jgi:aspartate/methionine/tyrosine aminotransferase
MSTPTAAGLSTAARLSAAARSVPGSGIREIAHLVAGREDVLHLEYGEPDFNAAPHIITAGAAAARAGARYTPTPGPMALREALAEKLLRIQGLRYAPEQIVVTAGGAQALSAAFAAFVEPGDGVLLPDPGFPNFTMLARLHAAQITYYPLHPSAGFLPSPDEVRSLLTPATRLLVINSPSNPTGATLPADTVEQIVRAAAENGTTVLSDEVYDELLFSGEPVAAARFAPEHVVSVYSFSKTYAMTGWRLGYLAAAPDVAMTLARLEEPLISCSSAIAQAGAMAALTGPQDTTAQMRAAYQRRRDMVLSKFRAAGIDIPTPTGAFYCMLPLGSGTDSRAAALALVEEGVACAPGTAFGTVAADHLRLSLAAADDVLEEAADRIIKWMS